MNWLNRLDDALEDALTPNTSRHGRSSKKEDSHNIASDLQRALQDIHDSSSSDEDEAQRRLPHSSKPPLPPSSSPMIPGRLRRKTPQRRTISLPGSLSRKTSTKDESTLPAPMDLSNQLETASEKYDVFETSIQSNQKEAAHEVAVQDSTRAIIDAPMDVSSANGESRTMDQSRHSLVSDLSNSMSTVSATPVRAAYPGLLKRVQSAGNDEKSSEETEADGEEKGVSVPPSPTRDEVYIDGERVDNTALSKFDSDTKERKRTVMSEQPPVVDIVDVQERQPISNEITAEKKSRLSPEHELRILPHARNGDRALLVPVSRSVQQKMAEETPKTKPTSPPPTEESDLVDIPVEDRSPVSTEKENLNASADSLVVANEEQKNGVLDDVPRQVTYRSEFDAGNVSGLWAPPEENLDFDPRRNCKGTIHARILRAQRLPCSVGSTVQAIVSLQPWKGRIRTSKTTAFFGPSDENGVCVQWDEDETEPLLMVHAYSGEESPVPTLAIDLRFIPLGFGFSMCTLDLDCSFLLMNPLRPSRTWFTTSNVVATDENGSRIPLVEVEAMFEPDADPVSDSVSLSLPSPNATNHAPDSASFHTASGRTIQPSVAKDELSVQSFSLAGSSQRRLNTKPHHLQLKIFRTPAYCLNCKRGIMSNLWSKKAFRCETCKVDCCSDCRLQIDVQLPCGSEAAKLAVDKSIQNKLTVNNLMAVVAPVSEEHEVKDASFEKENASMDETKGIGTLGIEFVRSFALLESDFLAPETDPSTVLNKLHQLTLLESDYYMRVSLVGTSLTCRTETVQNSGGPRFSSGEMRLSVPHYGAEFRVELVDASTERTIGTFCLSAQSLLQRQRDITIENDGLSLRPSTFKGRLTLYLDLRKDMKSSPDSEFYSPLKTNPIVGFAEVHVVLEESMDRLFGTSPYVCPPRPDPGLDLNLFQIHLKRIGALIEDVKFTINTYQVIVSWEKPLLTFVSYLIFARFCMWFDPAYMGSVPVLLLIIYMAFSGVNRLLGMHQQKWIERETRVLQNAENANVDYTLHRPIGIIGISVEQGRNLRSAELGLPGNTGCTIYWDPVRLADDAEKATLARLDSSSDAPHEMGSTDFLYSTGPSWKVVHESETTRRTLSVISTGIESTEKLPSHNQDELLFPLLQPFGEDEVETFSLQPWSSSVGAIVVCIKFNDVLSVVPGSEYTLGEVCIPLSFLCSKGKASGWFHVSTEGFASTATLASEDDGKPQLFLSARWISPKLSSQPPSASDREMSIVLQEEMIRSAVLSKEQRPTIGSALVGTSLGALETVRGLSNHLLLVQNTIGTIVDTVEASRNALNFTDPWKSSYILLLLLLLWTIFAWVPLRVIVFVLGSAPYGITFVARYGKVFRRFLDAAKNRPRQAKPPVVLKPDSSHRVLSRPVRDSVIDDGGTPGGPPPLLTWLTNAFYGLPTDEDLRKTYFWSTRRYALQEAEVLITAKRKRRLQALWRASWHSSIRVLTATDSKDVSFRWNDMFAIVQGHRFVAWDSVAEFDNGNAPSRTILLAGHAGLATPSPREIRMIDQSDIDKIVCLFGRGEKLTLLLSSTEQKALLEGAVENALNSKKD